MSDLPFHSQTDDPEPGTRIGAYTVIKKLAQGGMASVLSVRDERDGHVVAMKLLLPLAHAEESRGRFRREFRALSRVQHPNVLQVFEWGLIGDRPWFTMELLHGHDLREEVALLRELTPEARCDRAEEILKGVTKALAYIHDRGMIHRDVTPGNIFVSTDGAIKLMDFGVVKEMGAELTAVGEVIGTVAYMPPEQIRGEPVDARADLYALGAVLYLLLTGRRPFSAHTIHGFMEKHLNTVPERPRIVDPHIPPHLDEICMRLLEKQPADRYASASHLSYVLGSVEDSEELEDAWPPRTAGRSMQKAAIREALQEVASGMPGRAMLLSAPLGFGKTRMMQLTQQCGRRVGLPVAHGRCRAHDRPFGAFVGVYRDLRGAHPPELLEEVFGASAPDKQWERYAVIAAFKDFLVDRAPCTVLLDNLERADPATIEMLGYLIRNTLELASEPVLFVLAHDSQEVNLRRQIESMPAVEVHELAPLEKVEVEEVVVSVLNSDPAALALADRLFRESSGSPAFIADMLRGLIDDGHIVQSFEDGLRLTVEASQITRSRLPMPASLRQALQDRLAPLSDRAVEIGKILALTHRPLDADVVLHVSGFHEEDAIEALDELIDANIVVEERAGEEERVELSHGRFREVLLDLWDPTSLRATHCRLGEHLEREHRNDILQVVEDLAYHFEMAGIAPKAYAYLIRTATRHLNRSLFEEALVFLDRALALEPDARRFMVLEKADRELTEVWLATSQARFQLGQQERAMEAIREAEGLANKLMDLRRQSRVAHELGVQLRQQGKSHQAAEQLRIAIQRAEDAGDQKLLPGPLYQLGGVLWGRGNLPAAERTWQRALTIATQVGDERSQGHGYNGLAILAICRGQSMEARKHLEQSARVFERLGMLGPLVIARVNLIELYLNTGILRKALALADRTLAQADEVGHVQGIALGHAWRARCLLFSGKLREASTSNDAALRIVQALGHREDEALTLANRVEIQLESEEPTAALASCLELRAVLAEHDHEGILAEVVSWHAESLGRLQRREEALVVLAEAPPATELWPHVQIRADLARGRTMRILGDTAQALELLTRCLEAAESNGYRTFQLIAHVELTKVTTDATARAKHERIARGLARSLAANFTKKDSETFLHHHTRDLDTSA